MNAIAIKKGLIVFIAATFLTFGFIGCSQAHTQEAASHPITIASPPAKKANSPITSQIDFRTIVAKVAQDSLPAVVHINVTQQQEVSTPFLPFQNDPFFHFFFNGPNNTPRKFRRELKGLGSGMIMSADGYILTNNHVVAGATTMQVTLADGSQYPAKLIGTDPKTDLAVVKINADKKLPHVTFGDSDKLVVGDWVVAIGDPRGLTQTVTQGIISAKHRHGIMDPTSYEDYLQTDAAINPGNSGGPLLNLDGQVVGINSAIESTSGGFQGIGFAIPSDMAVHIANQLIANGKVERGWLGVSIKNTTPAEAKSSKIKFIKGALVVDVVKGSPADDAGLKKDDVVIGFEGQPIASARDLQNAVADAKIDHDAAITVLRNGRKRKLTVHIGSQQEAIKKMAASAEQRLGVSVRPLTADESQKYGQEKDAGVAIASIEANGPMAQAGFEVDDIITAINNTPVNGVQGFADIVKSLHARQNVVLSAIDHRSGQTGYVQLTTR
jgi:Do/DeqQ family serine protease